MTMKQNSPHQSKWWWSAPKLTLPGRTPNLNNQAASRPQLGFWGGLMFSISAFPVPTEWSNSTLCITVLVWRPAGERQSEGAGRMNESTQNAFSPLYITWTSTDRAWWSLTGAFDAQSNRNIFNGMVKCFCECVLRVVLCVLLGEIGSEISF